MTVNKSIEIVPCDELIQHISDKILLLEKTDKNYYRLKFPIDMIDPLDWLRSQTKSNKIYWRSYSDTIEFAGCGEVESYKGKSIEETYSTISNIENNIACSNEESENIRYWGGIRFQDNYNNLQFDEEWSDFGVSWFVLPRFELINNKNNCHFIVNLKKSDLDSNNRTKVISDLKKLDFTDTDEAEIELNYSGKRTDNPTKERWHQNVESALEEFEKGKADKLVLARKSSFLFNNKINSWTLLKKLREQSINCYLFGFQPGNDTVFFGATPEKLYKVDNESFSTEAIAGTRPRGKTSEDDERLAGELISSEKDRREHQIVINAIKKGLLDLGLKGEIDQTISIRKLARVQHLVIAIKAKLSGNISNKDFLLHLHPTPAVGGNPSKRAIELIESFEKFDRGWYSGPVGYIGKNRSEFVVAIRSALTNINKIYLYSGAGIVEGSNPKQEWDEIESKIQTMIHAIGND